MLQTRAEKLQAQITGTLDGPPGVIFYLSIYTMFQKINLPFALGRNII
jgi:hypothetical protein